MTRLTALKELLERIVKPLEWEWIGDTHAFGHGAGHSYEILYCSELPEFGQSKRWRGKNLGYKKGTTEHLGYEWFETREEAIEARNSEHRARVRSALAPLSGETAARVLLDATDEDGEIDDTIQTAMQTEADTDGTDEWVFVFRAALRALAGEG